MEYKSHHGQVFDIEGEWLMFNDIYIGKEQLEALTNKVNIIDDILTSSGYKTILCSDLNTFKIGKMLITIIDLDNILKLFPKT
jgi:hypothetical protein